MTKQRILYYAKEYYCDYGARTHAREFYSHLQQKVGKNQVFLFPPSEPSPMPSAANTKISRLKQLIPEKLQITLQSFFWNKKEFKQLEDYIIKNAIDIIVIRAGYKIAFINQLQKIRRLKKVIIEVNASTTDEQLNRSFLALILKSVEINCYKKADFITVVSPLLANKFRERGLKKEKILINPNGVNEHFFKPDPAVVSKLKKELEIPSETTIVGYIGGFEKFKLIPQIIHDFLTVNSTQHLTLLIIGKGEDSNKIQVILQKLRNKTNRKIIFINTWIPYSQLSNYMDLFDINIFPYTAEHVSPLKIFEYLATGKPTIGPNIPALKDIFKNRKELYFVSQDKKDFKNILELVLNNKKEAELVGINGKKMVLTEYTWNANVDRILVNL